jgi:hypothetical protein
VLDFVLFLTSTDRANFEFALADIRCVLDRASDRDFYQSDCLGDIFKRLLHYIDEGDSERKWQRALASGIIRTDEGLAVNVHQMEKIVGRGKSFINGYLRRHYDSCQFPSQCCKAFSMMPIFIRDNRKVYERWTMRYYRKSSFMRGRLCLNSKGVESSDGRADDTESRAEGESPAEGELACEDSDEWNAFVSDDGDCPSD